METNETDVIWELLSDRSRRAVFTTLAERPLAVGELAQRLPISRPAVSQHLRALKDAGVVTAEVQGTRRVYRLNPVAVSAFKDQLDRFWNSTLSGFQKVTESTESTESKGEP